MHNIITDLKNTNSRIDKEAILEKAWNDGYKDLFKCFLLCYDNFVTFGVKQVPKYDECRRTVFGTDHGPNITFYELCSLLSTRKLTGYDARDKISEWGSYQEPGMWDGFYRLILQKDLKAGISDKTINKILDKIGTPEALSYKIPDRSCQLADSYEKVNYKYKQGKKLVDYKFDGVRVYTIVDIENKMVTMHTRNGLLLENFPKHVEDFMLYLNNNMGNITESFVIDGEMNAADFWKLMKQLRRKDGADTSDFVYTVFDIIPLKDFNKGFCAISHNERYEMLKCLIETNFNNNPRIVLVEQEEIDLDTQEGKIRLNSIYEEALELGLEGIMIKDPNAPYECKRTKHWLKAKPFIQVTLKIIGFENGEKETRLENTVGAVLLSGTDNEYPDYIIEARVGSMPDDVREMFNNDKESFIGMLADVTGDILTQSEDNKGTNKYSLRFPRELRLRELEKGKGKI